MIIADLQIHSRYARACSPAITIDALEKYSRIKGLHIIGTGDFQHPLWRKEIDEKLKEDDNGILRTSSGFPFLWQTEVSLMYSQDGKRRAVHHLIFSPNTNVSNEITKYLGSKGRLDYDGRPIFGMTSPQLVEDLKKLSDEIEIIPAHCLLPNEKIMCNPSPKKISDIEIGEKVLTHTGNYKKVTATFVRPYKGKIYSIQPYYFREGINTTSEHPFFAIKTVKDCSFVGGLCKPNSISKGKHKCTKKHYNDYKSEWIPAEKLEVNDVLLYPRQKETTDLQEIKISSILNKEDFVVKSDKIYSKAGRQDKGIFDIIKVDNNLCRLVGYYLAEGYITKKTNCIQFSFGKHEDIYIAEVINLMKTCFNVELGKKRERNGYELYFYSKILVNLFEKLFYEPNTQLRAHSKKLSDHFIYLPLEKQIEIFRGWWRGDSGVTVSEILAQQMKLICLRLGIIPSIYKLPKEDGTKYKRFIHGRKINVNYDAYFLQRLSFYEDKFNLLKEAEFIKFNTKLNRKHGWLDDNYVYIPIKSIETLDYEGEVYNLEVEEDNSFVTPSATVHNCMTPWFGLFGSKSGFDSLAECFQEQRKHIYAVESGMSADPSMIWRLKENTSIVSFSDLHSFWPWRIGREATIFDINIDALSYKSIIKQIRENSFHATIETDPAYGKYHYDGHRTCNFSCSPAKSKELNGICPVCGKELTIGVDNRIEQLAKMPAGYFPAKRKKFYKLLPLHELIAFHIKSSLSSKKTWLIYNQLIEKFGNEFNVLIKIEKIDIINAGFKQELAELIINNRIGNLKVKPGYDGVYGEIQESVQQKRLF
ncbi:hypothetical protein HYV49_04305 [Candidatus Pacearchaeota archaeon]|nr:hypothetical protein [Candidatus Pacearchaeota archaeon]